MLILNLNLALGVYDIIFLHVSNLEISFQILGTVLLCSPACNRLAREAVAVDGFWHLACLAAVQSDNPVLVL